MVCISTAIDLCEKFDKMLSKYINSDFRTLGNIKLLLNIRPQTKKAPEQEPRPSH